VLVSVVIKGVFFVGVLVFVCSVCGVCWCVLVCVFVRSVYGVPEVRGVCSGVCGGVLGVCFGAKCVRCA
jgi:hypothetical protein